jgi:hypothetical protein
LIVDDISIGQASLCFGKNVGEVPVTVRIRNIGLGKATMPAFNKWWPWYWIWSIPTTSDGVKVEGYLPELPSKSSYDFFVAMKVKAVPAAGRSKITSTITIGVVANPAPPRWIAEKTYDNNYKEKQFKIAGAFCP